MAEAIAIKKPTRTLASTRKNKARSVRLVNFETGEYVSILPMLGATVRELVLRCDKRLFSLLEFPMFYEETVKNKHFAGVKLIPFPGRITNATYRFGGRTHKLRVNSSDNFAIHGFFTDKSFRLVEATAKDRSASITLDALHKGNVKGYPYKFSVRLSYTLKSGSFACTTEIRNTDSKPIPIGDGWHPYFKTSRSVKRLLLSIPAHSVVEVTPSKVPTELDSAEQQDTRFSVRFWQETAEGNDEAYRSKAGCGNSTLAGFRSGSVQVFDTLQACFSNVGSD
jgi:galactose mutarotase-like enzyme